MNPKNNFAKYIDWDMYFTITLWYSLHTIYDTICPDLIMLIIEPREKW